MSAQISAYISDATKIAFEDFSKKFGQKKGFIIEQALLHYINAQNELPNDIIIPPMMSVSKEAFEQVVLKNQEPTQALIKLMNEARD